MLTASLLSVVLTGALQPDCCQAAPIDFAHDVVPILREHCVRCHGGAEAKGGFSINTRALFLESGVAEPGVADESTFLELVASEDPDLQMPPKDLPRVTKEQQQVLARWVDAGMPWPDDLTFAEQTYQPPLLPRSVQLPEERSDRNPIDQLLTRYYSEHQAEAPEPAADATFLRRASLDLVGLLPTEDELDSFLANGEANQRERLVDDLLARDVDYAEHWLTFWNDLLRNDYDGTGFITGGRKQISQWLYEALVQNKPFDQFTRELISPPTDASRGFIDGIKWRGTVSAGQTVEIQFAQNVAQAFLGINLKCASCHDSFIDRWKLTDAYSLAAVYATEPLEIHRCDKPIGQTASAGWLFPELGTIDPNAARQQRLEQLAALITDDDNGRFARTIVNRLWARLMGRGLVHPLDAMHTRPWDSDLLDYLAGYLVEHDYDLKAVLRLIATSQAYGARSEIVSEESSAGSEYTYTGPRPKRMTAEQFVDSVWQLTEAAPQEFDAPVLRGKVDPDVVASLELEGQWIWGDVADGTPGGGRLSFRKQLHLPAAVRSGAAVITAHDAFELYLGGRKVASGKGWSRVQTVSLSGRLQQGDNTIVIVAENFTDAPDPAGLFFEARLVLEDGSEVAFASDDSWEYSSKLPTGREGRLGRVAGPWKAVTTVGRPEKYRSIDAAAKNGLAAGVSASDKMVRAALMKSDFLMRSLGRPNRDQIVSSRPDQLTTLEAVDLSAGERLAEALAAGARRWKNQDLATTELARQIYRQALSREPTEAEYKTITEALGPSPSVEAIEDLLWAVCLMPEYLIIR
ncbi:DUF1549 domain-containing protein [Roseiconus nitratireducens]|uniref:DUF1549 domain-containing protein n=2 Tax=Roseiconus nitratireducens TaxID=2605748 RepID=A0A5M6D3K4_9BACT|nr:DUF1549 domain-containing protein [Roseiconus nitratireducens]